MNLILAVTGATGALAARLLMDRSPWPVALVASKWGKDVYQRECGSFEQLAAKAAEVYDDSDLSAPIASGSVPTAGMVILPCTSSAMAHIAAGTGETLIARAAHCHLKERRPLVLCVRETPWSLIDLDNARAVAAAVAVRRGAGGRDPLADALAHRLVALAFLRLSLFYGRRRR